MALKEIAPGLPLDEVKQATTGCNLIIPNEVPPGEDAREFREDPPPAERPIHGRRTRA